MDPPGCRDIDDALSAVVVPKNDGVEGEEEIEIGVHIADVTTFLKPGTPMDDEALRRGTTTYLVQRRLDMLPKPLTEDICSLRADVERLRVFGFLARRSSHDAPEKRRQTTLHEINH